MAKRAGKFRELKGETLTSLRNSCYTIKCFDILSTLTYTHFFRNYLIPNCPCIFSSKITAAWKGRHEWVADDGTPDFEYLTRHFGQACVSVANCKQEQYSSHPKQELSLSDYLVYWQKYRQDGYPAQQDCLYLKDWHFTKAFPDYKAYETPVYFQSDWLNEFWDTLPEDDYRFVYMGPKGTWTPFHSDVYRSFSWSANICGRKKWVFYPPGCEECLKDKFGQLVYDITSSDLDDPAKYPRASEVKDKAIEVIQEQGQVIFVPSGWHHQVLNLEDTISINHNWLNGCNVDITWCHMVNSLNEVKREIADCRDMDGWHLQCQIILKASAGIDFKMFIDLLETIATNRIKVLGQKNISEAHNMRLFSEESENNIISKHSQDYDNKTKDNDTSRGECNNVLSAYEYHRHLEPCCTQSTDCLTAMSALQMQEKTNHAEINVNMDSFLKRNRTTISKEDGKESPSCDTDEILISCENRTNICLTGLSKNLCDVVKDELCTNDLSNTTFVNDSGASACAKDKSQNTCKHKETGSSFDLMLEKNDLLSTKDFILYDLMRIEEVVRLILDHEDLEYLSPDFTATLDKILASIVEAFNIVDP